MQLMEVDDRMISAYGCHRPFVFVAEWFAFVGIVKVGCKTVALLYGDLCELWTSSLPDFVGVIRYVSDSIHVISAFDLVIFIDRKSSSGAR